VTSETAQVRVRDLRVTRSPFLGYLCLSPASGCPPTRDEVERRRLIDAQHREKEKIAAVNGLPLWMLRPCPNGEVPCECLRGLAVCSELRDCFRRRLTAYGERNP
jgi:hypothetical protein